MASFCGGGISAHNGQNLIPGVSWAQLETPVELLLLAKSGVSSPSHGTIL